MPRRRIAVACGVLRKPSGEVLITQRPAGKIAAGKWEFPGGKIEAGESPLQALTRELHEEIGITVSQARPLIQVHHDYSDRSVTLDTWLVTAWQGEVLGRENQAHAWTPADCLHDYDLLGADGPIVTALRLPGHYVFTPEDATLEFLQSRIPLLSPSCLLRLRLPRLSDDEYRRCVLQLQPLLANRMFVLDRDPQMALELGATAWHAPAVVWRSTRVLPQGLMAIASCHSADDLAAVRSLGYHAAVMGSVLPTTSHAGQAGLGWQQFSFAVAQASIPVYALGGMKPADTAQAWSCYAQGVAGIQAFWPQ